MSPRRGLDGIFAHTHAAENMRAVARRSVVGLLLFAGLLAVTVMFSGGTSTAERGGVASVRAADLPAPAAVAATAPIRLATAIGAPQSKEIDEGTVPQSVQATRKKARCVGCGVVESVYRSERPERAVGACFWSELAGSLLAFAAHDDGAYNAVSTVGAIGALAFAQRPDSRTPAPVLSYQIVVRLADGSRVVFNEPTARSFQAGERILVIAGPTAAAF
jgi:hypothetical protein